METLAATSDGKVWAWGYDGDGYLGVGPVGGYRTNKPMRVIGIGNATALSAGTHNLAVAAPATLAQSTITLNVAKTGTAGGGDLKIKGAVSPNRGGSSVTVTLYRWNSFGEYGKVARKQSTLDAQSTYSASFGRPRSGKCKVMVAIAGDADHLAAKKTQLFKC